MITLSTTGILSTIIIADLGGREFSHPTVDYNLLEEYTIEEIRDSESLKALMDSSSISIKQDGNVIANSVDLGLIEVANEGGGGPGDDKYFKINPSDTTSDYHENKVVDSLSIIWEIIDNAGVKTRRAKINPDHEFEFNGEININGAITFGPAITVPITGSINNLNIVNLGSNVLVRLSPSGNYNLTGVVPNDVTKGQWIIVINVGPGQVTIKENDAGSDPDNRFLIGGSRTIQEDEGLALVYDTVDNRWRSFAINV